MDVQDRTPETGKPQKLMQLKGSDLLGLPLNTEYRALAADGRTAHGLSPVLAILDEIGQVRGPQSDFVDAITTSQGAHEAPLLIAISTQAASDAEVHDAACAAEADEFISALDQGYAAEMGERGVRLSGGRTWL